MNKQQLASKIWESANKMRSKIEANEYKDYILGFIFYKFLSDREERFFLKDGWTKNDLKTLTEEDTEDLKYSQENLGYFIAYPNLFNTWLEMGRDFNVSNVRDSLSAFNRLISPTFKKVFEKIFQTLDTGLSKLGDNANSQTKSISDLIKIIKDIPTDDKQDYDVLGFIYEYLISNFAANAGKKAGEFYTPHEVSQLMAEIVADHLKGKESIQIYDPTSGSGSLLITIGRAVSKYLGDKNKVKYYAQELKENTYNLTRMNLVMRGILPDNIVTRNADTLAPQDWPLIDDEGNYNVLRVDAVVANPPYSQSWDTESFDRNSDPRFGPYGVAPSGKADYAFLLHNLYHINQEGIVTIVLPHGVLFRGGEEEKIRKNLIENNNIDAIIGLPANIFYGTGIATLIMVLKKNKSDTNIMIIDASKGFVKEGKNNKLRACDIKKIVDAVKARTSISGFAKLVTLEEIRANDYNLNIPRYVDSGEKEEPYDVYALINGGLPVNEIDDLSPYWSEFPNLKETLFEKIQGPYFRLKTKDVDQTIRGSLDVTHYKENYAKAFSGFEDYLINVLLLNLDKIDVTNEEEKLSTDIDKRISFTKLIDKYSEVYQVLDNDWKKISLDIDIIKTEGFESVKIVEPNMIIKKIKGEDQEIQDGYKGRVIPFELVQKEYMNDEVKAVESKENRLAEIESDLQEFSESFSEEDKDENKDLFSDDECTNLSYGDVAKKAKALLKAKDENLLVSDSIESEIVKAGKWIEEDKALKKEIRALQEELITESKNKIESLSDDEARSLLKDKWIRPLLESFANIPERIIDKLVSKITALNEKYAETYRDIDKSIAQTEAELSNMLGELTGNEYDMKGLADFKDLLNGK